MQQSESIAEIAQAICKAQAECEAATKDASNPFFKSKYATLEEIIAVLKKPLANNGLCINQFTDFNEDCSWLTTQISHSSGQWMRGRYLLTPTDNKPQSVGSSLSYAKRYALQAVMLVPSEDDDGNAAQSATQARKPPMAANTQKTNTKPTAAPTEPLRVLYGNLAGTLLNDLKSNQLSELISYWEERAKREGKKLDGPVLNMVNEAKRLLK